MSQDQILEVSGPDCNVTVLDSVASTNEWVLQRAKSTGDFPFACFSEEQTQGRGRRGSSWISPSNSNIYMSLAWQSDLSVSELGALSIIIGIAVIRVLENIGIKQALLKWPNDILVDDKKIAGILIETTRSDEGKLIIVVGVGLNYNWPATSMEAPDQPWIDVISLLETEFLVSRSSLAGLLLKECIEMCELYPHNNVWLLDEYRAKYDICLHEEVDVILGNGLKFCGVANGVTSTGEIRVLINGEERVFNSADISLRKTGVSGGGSEMINPGNTEPC